MRFRSIRQRLIVSYVALTLLTVSTMSLLALTLVERYAVQQETGSLTANAEAVARQAGPLLRPAVRPLALHELARTSSFLGNARVRILDDRQRPLADSGPRGPGEEILWIVSPGQPGVPAPEAADRPVILALPPGPHSALPAHPVPPPDAPFLEELPPGTELNIVRRVEGPWGNQFIFERREGQPAVPAPEIDPAATPGALVAANPIRSSRVITVPITDGNRPIGSVELSGGPDFSAEAIATTRRAVLIASVGATALAILVGLVVSRGLTAPLHSLAIAARRMSSGDLSARAPVRGADETGQLARQFNRMAERLEASFGQLAAERDALRRFIADASHELRTPITALKTFNELLRGGADDNRAVRAEFLAESQAQLDRLARITEGLLDLSRLDAGLITLNLAEHTVGEVVEGALGAFRVIAQETGIALTVSLPDPALTMECDRARIELALANLVDNALKVTPAGGSVEVGATALATDELAGAGQPAAGPGSDGPGGGQMVRLWVRDNGPGIDPDDRPRIFERFYRGRTATGEGSGLGLAIVQSVAQAHGGRVAVESEAGAGSRFLIDLPTRHEPQPSGPS